MIKVAAGATVFIAAVAFFGHSIAVGFSPVETKIEGSGTSLVLNEDTNDVAAAPAPSPTQVSVHEEIEAMTDLASVCSEPEVDEVRQQMHALADEVYSTNPGTALVYGASDVGPTAEMDAVTITVTCTDLSLSALTAAGESVEPTVEAINAVLAN